MVDWPHKWDKIKESKMGMVRVYNRVLSSKEIEWIYMSTSFNHIDWCSSTGSFGDLDCDCPELPREERLLKKFDEIKTIDPLWCDCGTGYPSYGIGKYKHLPSCRYGVIEDFLDTKGLFSETGSGT